MMEPRIRVVVQEWGTDGPPAEGEEPNALLHGRVFVGDVELPAAGATIRARGGDFVEVDVTLTGNVQIVPVSAERFRRDDPFALSLAETGPRPVG